jgi:hypothetical protein
VYQEIAEQSRRSSVQYTGTHLSQQVSCVQASTTAGTAVEQAMCGAQGCALSHLHGPSVSKLGEAAVVGGVDVDRAEVVGELAQILLAPTHGLGLGIDGLEVHTSETARWVPRLRVQPPAWAEVGRVEAVEQRPALGT